MTENYIAIGDIHGRFDLLTQLLKLIDEGEFKDYPLVFLGDLIDRGPDAFKVVAKVKELVEAGRAQALYGNHEDFAIQFHKEKIFDWEHIWMHPGNGGRATVNSYLKEMGKEGDAHFFDAFEESGHAEWIKKLPLFIETDKVWFSHAPIPKPGVGNGGGDDFWRPYWREGQDFRARQEALIWTYLGDEREGELVWDHKKLAICGHIHAILRNILQPRVYEHIIYSDTGSGCAKWGRLSGIIITDGKYTGYMQATPDVPAPTTIEETYARLRADRK